MNTKVSVNPHLTSPPQIENLSEQFSYYENKVKFFEKNFSDLFELFKNEPPSKNLQQLSKADTDLLHTLGLTVQNIQTLPSLSMVSFILANLFSCLLIVTHLLLFQKVSEWGDLFPAYLECFVFFLLCICAGLMLRATRVTRKIDDVLCSIGALLGLLLAFGLVQRLFFYAENLNSFSLEKYFIPIQIFQLYTQFPTGIWSQFLLIIMCVLGGLVFYISSYVYSASPDISNMVRRCPNVFQIQDTNESHQQRRDSVQTLHKANSNLKAFSRMKNKLISECVEHPLFAHLQLSPLVEHQDDLISQIQEQITFLLLDQNDLDQQLQLERIQDVLSRIQLLSQDALSLQQHFEQFNQVATERF